MINFNNRLGKNRGRLGVTGLALLVFLLFNLLGAAALAASQTPPEISSPPPAAVASLLSLPPVAGGPGGVLLQAPDVVTPNLQVATTPTPTLPLTATPSYSFSLAALGFEGGSTLNSPAGRAEYTFRIPENWLIETDGLLELDLSYAYNQVQAENIPALFGDLTISLDNQTLEVFTIETPELNHFRLRIPLPVALLSNPDRPQHAISLRFDAGLLCNIPHQAKLLVHPNSAIFFDYEQRPLELDLGRYPWPFFQRTFTPDQVRFVLPAAPASQDASNALALAAQLGSLTLRQMVISATTDSLFLDAQPVTSEEHLIVLGRPQDNELISFLNEEIELPVSLHRQQLELVSQGPAAVAPGGTFTYTFTLTNSLDRVVNLRVLNALSNRAELVECTPICTSSNDLITWDSLALASNGTLELSLTLKASETLSGTRLENTVSVIGANLGPLSADTLTASVERALSSPELQQTQVNLDDYFFFYNGQAVAKEDGIVQEVLSPWQEDRAILIVTGLTEEAVRKASQAMSSRTRFPGLNGPVALVQDALAPSEMVEPASAATDIQTFGDLGYVDKIIRGETSQGSPYSFFVPFGWRLSEGAAVDLYFNHSQLLDFQNSSLSVLLNGQPMTTIGLDEKTATDGQLHLDLTEANVRTGQSNLLIVQVEMSLPGECADPDGEQAWFLIKGSSTINLAHEEEETSFNLVNLMYPFDATESLADLLIMLPQEPTLEEWDVALNLAEVLGNSAAGRAMQPIAILGETDTPDDLADYNIIAIGRPSRQPLIQEINDQLPQPFMAGSDQIEQKLDNIIFRLPPGLDLGYLQLIASPWNETRAVLALTGTTDEGLLQAATVLARTPWLLTEGNLALIREGRTTSLETRAISSTEMAEAMTTVVPELTPVATVTPTTTPTPMPALSIAQPPQVQGSRPIWLIPMIVLTGLIVVASFAIAFWQMRRRVSS